MLVKNRAWFAYVFAALGLLFATSLLYHSGTIQKAASSADWPHFGSSNGGSSSPEKIDTDSSNNNPEHVDSSSPASTGAHADSPATHSLAIATFLTGQAADDTYFNSTRVLAYQLLHAPDTRIQNPDLTFVVLCGRQLPEAKREMLRKDGATVIALDDVELPSWIHVSEARWSEQFTKLRVFELTQFKRLLYIDADYLIMHRMDAIFDEPIVKSLAPTIYDGREEEIHEDEGPLPKQWLFAGRSENGGIGGFDHVVPPLNTNYANGGFFLIAPAKEMYDHLMTVMQVENRFNTLYMEQDMLNYVFRRSGPMPWRELSWTWSSNFVNQADVDGGVHALHGKFWKEGPQSARQKWANVKVTLDEWVKNGRS